MLQTLVRGLTSLGPRSARLAESSCVHRGGGCPSYSSGSVGCGRVCDYEGGCDQGWACAEFAGRGQELARSSEDHHVRPVVFRPEPPVDNS